MMYVQCTFCIVLTSVKCNFGSENGKRILQIKRVGFEPLLRSQKGLIMLPTSFQGQAFNVNLTQINPLQPECQPLKEGW